MKIFSLNSQICIYRKGNKCLECLVMWCCTFTMGFIWCSLLFVCLLRDFLLLVEDVRVNSGFHVYKGDFLIIYVHWEGFLGCFISSALPRIPSMAKDSTEYDVLIGYWFKSIQVISGLFSFCYWWPSVRISSLRE